MVLILIKEKCVIGYYIYCKLTNIKYTQNNDADYSENAYNYK